jgi:A/G-specific adenine glycosylase
MRRALLRWFRRHARPLPWRKAKSAYRVWVSEVMLQQTQVDTVIPYYTRFIGAFPTLKRLAEAPTERVLELWSGLGYYRRARHLHLAAQKIAREFGGRFPSDYAQARSLPGIGDYSARAILSIAYGQPYAVVDGNVARVAARLGTIQGNLHQPAFRRWVEQALEGLLSRRRPGDFNQAWMELGQTVCLPRAPRCSVCPLGTWCEAYRQGKPESYPAPRPRRATELRYLASAIIRRRGQARHQPQAALMRGLDEGLLGDLWNFPAAFGASRAEAFGRLREKLARVAPAAVLWGEEGRAAPPAPLRQLRHGITYRSIRVDLYAGEIPRGVPVGPLRWFPLASLDRAAISQLARKIAAGLVGNSSTAISNED